MEMFPNALPLSSARFTYAFLSFAVLAAALVCDAPNASQALRAIHMDSITR